MICMSFCGGLKSNPPRCTVVILFLWVWQERACSLFLLQGFRFFSNRMHAHWSF